MNFFYIIFVYLNIKRNIAKNITRGIYIINNDLKLIFSKRVGGARIRSNNGTSLSAIGTASFIVHPCCIKVDNCGDKIDWL